MPIATQIILTGVSGSGKTTLMNNLVKRLPSVFSAPLQFTTRQSRNDNELDGYVFLTPHQFLQKLLNGDFIEFVEYYKNLYAVSKYFDTSTSNIFIAEPVGRSSLKRHFRLNGIPYKSFYIEVASHIIRHRLIQRGDTSTVIEDRMKDFKYFHSDKDDIVLDGILEPDKLTTHVLRHLGVSH